MKNVTMQWEVLERTDGSNRYPLMHGPQFFWITGVDVGEDLGIWADDYYDLYEQLYYLCGRGDGLNSGIAFPITAKSEWDGKRYKFERKAMTGYLMAFVPWEHVTIFDYAGHELQFAVVDEEG